MTVVVVAVEGSRNSRTATRIDGEMTPSPTTRGPGSTREGHAPHVPPTHIGRFVVLRKLGEGGMGVVYTAYDEELERKVAIKLLRGEFHGQRQSVGQARLLREAQAMAKLSHPNIVQVYEVGKLGSGVFLAMEFVHGCDLREWHQRGAHDWRTTLAVYVQAGQGLIAAHAAGIVHRDFKPDNVLIGEDGRVRVVDFGLARPGEPMPEESAAGLSSPRLSVELTQAGTFVGTPAYMAPEQLRRESADAKSDQFSFCVSLYEALYGYRPFPGNDTATLRDAVLYEEPLAPPRGTEVPWFVHQALLRGLQREGELRFADMQELLAALAADPSARRRRRLGIAGVVLASGLVAAGGAVAMYEWRASSEAACSGAEARLAGVWDAATAEATRAALVGTGVPYAEDVASRVQTRLDAYAMAWAAMHREACETHGREEQSDALFDLRMACLDERRTALRALVGVLAEADAEVVSQAVQAAENVPSLARCTDARALLAQSPLPEEPEQLKALEAMQERVATLHAKHKVGQYKAVVAGAGPLVEEIVALDYAPMLADVLSFLGDAEAEVGEYKTAEATLIRAIAVADGAGDDTMRAHAQLDLVRVVGLYQARYDEAASHAELLRGTLVRLAEAKPHEFSLEVRLGEISLQRGEFADAALHTERSLALGRQVYGEDSSQFGLALTKRGNLRFFRGELSEALGDYRRSAAIYEKCYGEHHPLLGTVLNNIGAVELTEFNSAAEATFTRARKILEGAYGETHPTLAALHTNLGVIAMFQGRPAQAVAELRQALAIYEGHLPAGHPTIANGLSELGEALLFAGDVEAARRIFERSLDVHRTAYGMGHAKVSLALASLGAAQLRAGDREAAEETLARALGEFKGAPDDAELGRAFAGRGALRLADGRVDEAIADLESAVERLARNPGAAPFHQAEAQFALARALWQQRKDNEARARSLAADARQNFSKVGPGFQAEAAKIDAWLAGLPATAD